VGGEGLGWCKGPTSSQRYINGGPQRKRGPAPEEILNGQQTAAWRAIGIQGGHKSVDFICRPCPPGSTIVIPLGGSA
jgi:hypothetical protein